jgi:cell division protein ZapD
MVFLAYVSYARRPDDTVTDKIAFEHPLNERCRTLLRLSHLFEQFAFHMPRESGWDSRAALGALLDIAAILSRADIKSDLLKELDRYRGSLGRVANKPGVDNERLSTVLGKIRDAEAELRNIQGQLGQALRSDDFLTSIQQRSSIPGGSFDFDLPQFHYWLKRPHPERAGILEEWHQAVAPVQQAVDLSVSLIRSSATPVRETASNGLFQRTLDMQLPAQMLRITLPKDAKLFAEISGSKHRFAIRFMSGTDCRHPKSVTHDVDFILTTCVI